jgi:hypothetical protein
MKLVNNPGKVIFTILLISFFLIAFSSCSSSKYGCPNSITKVEQNVTERG